MRSLFLSLGTLGLASGIAAGRWQLELLVWGRLGNDQLPLFWGFFGGLGILLACIGGGGGLLLAHLLKRGRFGLPLLGSVLVLGGVLTWFVPGNVKQQRPDVFLLLTDTTRADHLSIYGYERQTTPFLEELTSSSVLFTNGVSQGSHTIVTTPCILASCYPSEHGLTDYRDILDPKFTLVSETLNDAGYFTFAVVTNPHINARVGFDQGFTHFQSLGQGTSRAVLAERVNERALQVMDRHLSRLGGQGPQVAAGSEAEQGKSDHADEPLFGFLFYTDPHSPYVSPEPFRRMFDPDWDRDEYMEVWSKNRGRPTDRELFNMVAQYDGTIAYWDSQLRLFLDELSARRGADNRLLIYTSDHGEEFWDHGQYGHEHSLYEELVNVPLLISFPVPIHFPPLPRTSRVVDEVVASVDVVPTLLDFLRLPVAELARGTSALDPALGHDDPVEGRVAYLEEILDRYGPYDLRAVRTRDQKIVHILNERGTVPDENRLMFDLDGDPAETQNVYASQQGEALDSLLVERIAATIGARTNEAEELEEVDEARLQQLRLLGYID